MGHKRHSGYIVLLEMLLMVEELLKFSRSFQDGKKRTRFLKEDLPKVYSLIQVYLTTAKNVIN